MVFYLSGASPAYTGCPGKEAVKRVSALLCKNDI